MKKIKVPRGTVSRLAREFGCSNFLIQRALDGQAYTPVQRAIRERAIEYGGQYE